MSAPTADRTHLLDALRGFALFGVVWSNYAILSYWFFLSGAAKAALPGSALDEPLGFFHAVFIDGKFYSIFSLLFGIGFGFFLAKGRDGLWRFYRRMFILLIMGWVHLRYLWAGDILFLYAALGLVLPVFRSVSDRVLLIIATLLILSPIAIDAAHVLTDGAFNPSHGIHELVHARDAELGRTVFQDMAAIPAGGWAEFDRAHERTWLFRFEHLLESNRLPKVLGLFLLGLWVSRRSLFTDPAAHRALLVRVFRWGLALGVPFCTLMWWSAEHLEWLPKAEGLVHTVGYALGVVPLALAMASAFALLWSRDRWQPRLQVLAPMGRMALTNYLLQTIVAIGLFSGVGLGWGGRVSSVTFEALALAVFVVQVIWSRWWLARFHYGPLEWLWRSLTYGRVMVMRK